MMVESDYDIEYVTNKYVEMVDACDDISEEDNDLFCFQCGRFQL